MMKKQKNVKFSLKFKLLILLTVIPLVSLSLNLQMAINLFKDNMVAYVFDSSSAVSSSIAKQFDMEVDSFVSQIKLIMLGYDLKKKKLTKRAEDSFHSQSRIEALIIYKKKKDKYFLINSYFLDKSKEKEIKISDLNKILPNMIYSDKVLNVKGFAPTGSHFVISNRIEEKNLTIVGVYRSVDFLSQLRQGGVYLSFLLDSQNQVEAGASEVRDLIEKDKSFVNHLSKVSQSKIPTSAVEIEAEMDSYLLSYTDTAVDGVRAYSIVSKSKALKALEYLIIKSILFFIAILAAILIISILASSSLTWKLRELYNATLKISEGNFDLKLEHNSSDEVGGLVDGFNIMSEKVSQLLNETAEKARMQSELQTTQMIQETLYPEEEFEFGPIKIKGYFEPASECGGDWWSYSKVGNKIFLWIGDATGHGAPAALITSAAKSASTVIEHMSEMSPARALNILNEAIGKTAKGKVLMTFFVACIDLEKGEMTYSNASHDPPFIINKNEKLSRKNLKPLLEVNGPRLGDNLNFEYSNETIKFDDGDTIVLYTDGVFDVSDRDGQPWGERNFLKTLVKSFKNSEEITDRVTYLKNEIDDFRSGEDLIDDITLFMCEYKKTS